MISDAAWEGYIRTEVEFLPRHGERFTIRPAAPGVTGGWPVAFNPPVHLLTAWDPGTERPGEAVNRARQEELESDLRNRGLDFCPTIGRVPGSAHFEEGVAVSGLSVVDATGFGIRYGQDAIIEWTPAALTTVSCVDDRRHDGGWLM